MASQNWISIDISALQFATAMMDGLTPYELIAYQLIESGVRVKEVTASKVVVKEGTVHVTSINTMMNIFWYKDKSRLH